jgi:hypothetical protein
VQDWAGVIARSEATNQPRIFRVNTKSKSPVVNRTLSRCGAKIGCGAKRDRTQKAAVEVIRGGFLVLDIVKEEIPSLAGLAATYSSKP